MSQLPYLPQISSSIKCVGSYYSPPHIAKVINIPTYDHPDIYTVTFADGSISEYSDQSNILEAISPCLFVGHLVDGEPPIYVGIYVDDIIYFSASDKVKQKFEESLSLVGDVDFMGQVSHFLGIEFTWKHHSDGHLSVCLTSQSFTKTLIDSLGLQSSSVSSFTTPFRSGLVIDSIPHQEMDSESRDKLRLQYQSLVGSLNWLAHTTCPDLSTVVSLLAQHQNNPSQGHLDAANYVVKYLTNTQQLGIYLQVLKDHLWKHFFISHFRLKSYPCLMPIGVLRMLLKILLCWIFLYLLLGLCQCSTLTYWVHYIGSQNGNLLLQSVQRKQKFMQLASM
jgi:hypothetical protein